MFVFGSCSALFDDDTGSITVAAPSAARSMTDGTPDYYMITVLPISDSELQELLSEKEIFFLSWESVSYFSSSDFGFDVDNFDYYFHDVVAPGEKKTINNLENGKYLVFVGAVYYEENMYQSTGIKYYTPYTKYKTETGELYRYYDYDVIQLSGSVSVDLTLKAEKLF